MAGLYTISTSKASAPTRRRPRVASSAPTERSRTVWSRSCAWRVSPRSTAATRSWNRSDRTLTRGSASCRPRITTRIASCSRLSAFASTTCSAGAESRAVSASLTLQYDKVIYLITPGPDTNMVAGEHVTVCDYPDGRFKIRFEGRELPYTGVRSPPARSTKRRHRQQQTAQRRAPRSPATRSSRIPSAAAPAVRHVVTQPQKPTAEALTLCRLRRQTAALNVINGRREKAASPLQTRHPARWRKPATCVRWRDNECSRDQVQPSGFCQVEMSAFAVDRPAFSGPALGSGGWSWSAR